MMQKFFCVRNVLREFLIPSVLAMTLVALAGCGSGAPADNGTGTGTGTGTGNGGGTTTQTPGSIRITSTTSASSNTATISVTVLDTGNVVIPNQTVTLTTTTGSQLSAGPYVTDTSGTVTAVLTLNGVSTATVTAAAGTITATDNITISGTTGGTANKLSVAEDTTLITVSNTGLYQLPVSVLVTDTLGNPVPNASVSVSVEPVGYYKGTIDNTTCFAVYSPAVPFAVNNNSVISIGGVATTVGASAMAGDITASANTDGSGTATFTWTFLKQYAGWVVAQLSVSTATAQNVQTTDVRTIILPQAQLSPPCGLAGSPFN